MKTESGQIDHSARGISARILYVIMLLFGIVMLLLAAVINTYLLSILSPDRHLLPGTVDRVHAAQLSFLVAGAVLIVLALVMRKLELFSALSIRPRLLNGCLMILTLLLFVFSANSILGIRYFPERTTTVFTEDDKLGWKLKPNSSGEYQGVHYKISSKGLRSPYDDYAKPDRTKRILQLGDSVTIGNALSYEETSAYFLENLYQAADDSYDVQVINAGCDGYSPWQEYEFLRTEGIKYDPDIVTVGFVLNDVTEKFRLKKFGGTMVAGQLAAAEEYAGHSKSRLQRLLGRTPLYLFVKDLLAKARFGRDVASGAKKMEELQARDLINAADSEIVDRAWELTLENLRKIVDFCSERGIELIIIHIPFHIQCEVPKELNNPQMRIREFCRRHDVHYIDGLEVYAADRERFERDFDYYFKYRLKGAIDPMHPSSDGNRLIARAIYDYVAKNGLFEAED